MSPMIVFKAVPGRVQPTAGVSKQKSIVFNPGRDVFNQYMDRVQARRDFVQAGPVIVFNLTRRRSRTLRPISVCELRVQPSGGWVQGLAAEGVPRALPSRSCLVYFLYVSAPSTAWPTHRMPTTQHTTTGSGRPPVPVAIFLPPPRAAGHRLAAWHGLDARIVARLVATYTRPGDTVLDLDKHPTITRAARYLRRRPADIEAGAPPTSGRTGVGVIVWTPPTTLDLHQLVEAMRGYRSMLHLGGFLLTAVTTEPAGRRGTLVAAARTAGLRYHQHLLVVRRRLPEHEPRAEAATAAATPPQLVRGRHVRAHLDLLAFATATAPETTNGN